MSVNEEIKGEGKIFSIGHEQTKIFWMSLQGIWNSRKYIHVFHLHAICNLPLWLEWKEMFWLTIKIQPPPTTTPSFLSSYSLVSGKINLILIIYNILNYLHISIINIQNNPFKISIPLLRDRRKYFKKYVLYIHV